MFALLSYFSNSPVKKALGEVLSEKSTETPRDALEKVYVLSYE